MTIDDLIQWYGQLESKKSNWMSRWEDVRRFVMPDMDAVLTPMEPGEDRSLELLDSTAVEAAELLASTIHTFLTSPSTYWFDLGLEDDKLMKVKANLEWLQEVTRIMHREFQNSNFDTQMQKLWAMLPTIGTGVLFFDDYHDWGDFRFQAFTPVNMVFEEDRDGIVNRLYHKMKLTVRQIREQWPQAESERLDQQKAKPLETLEILHYCGPAQEWEGFEPGSTDSVSLYVLLADKTILNRRNNGKYASYPDFPYMVPRWATVPGEEFGRSPAMNSMGDIKTLIRIIELKLQGIALMILPPMTNENHCVDFSVSKGKIEPGCVYDKRTGGALEKIPCGADVNIAELELSEYRNRIKETFFYNALLLYPDKNYQTAYEVSRREDMILRLLGPNVARFKTELLDRLIRRGFNILRRAGRFPDPPSGLTDKNLKVVYIGPLARAQRMHEVQAIEKFYGYLAQLAQFKPEILLMVDDYEAVMFMAERIGVPMKVLLDKKMYTQMIDEIRKQRNQAAEAGNLREYAQAGQAAARGMANLPVLGGQ